MCYLIRCENCGEVMEYEEFYIHSKICKPELEKVEIPVEVKEKAK